jgi:hypothetical protein
MTIDVPNHHLIMVYHRVSWRSQKDTVLNVLLS